MSPNYIGVIERGEKLPSLDTLQVLADALGASPASLLGEEEHTGDPWLARILGAARAIPPAHRPLVLAFMRVAAAQPSSSAKRARKVKRAK